MLGPERGAVSTTAVRVSGLGGPRLWRSPFPYVVMHTEVSDVLLCLVWILFIFVHLMAFPGKETCRHSVETLHCAMQVPDLQEAGRLETWKPGSLGKPSTRCGRSAGGADGLSSSPHDARSLVLPAG